MAAEIIPLHNATIGDGIVLDTDAVLEAPKTRLREVVVLGVTHDGELWCSASHGMKDAIFLIERCKPELLSPPNERAT